MSTIDITAPTMIAWSEPSPSSPAPAARRCAASGLDRSVRPSKVVGHAVDATSQYLKYQLQPSQKSLTQNFGHSLIFSEKADANHPGSLPRRKPFRAKMRKNRLRAPVLSY